MTTEPKPSRILLPLGLLAGVAVVALACLFLYRPDRPVATIAPGTSTSPAFVVQIIRPRLGLPLGGILPPQLFGQDPHLGFESTSAGASVDKVSHEHLELRADKWELVLVLDSSGRVAPESEVIFEMVYEERTRRLRCRPADPAIGTFSTTELFGSHELSGSFDIELARCEDADTGTPINWPPEPLVLHGSFDRLLLDTKAE